MMMLALYQKNEEIASHNRVSTRKHPAKLQRALSPGLMVFRESHEILHQSVINLWKDRLFNYVVPQVTAQSSSRHESDTYIIDFGFSQPQPITANTIKHDLGFSLPHFRPHGLIFLQNMPDDPQNDLGTFLIHIQNVLCVFCSSTMNDEFRCNTSSPIWSELVFPDHEINVGVNQHHCQAWEW